MGIWINFAFNLCFIIVYAKKLWRVSIDCVCIVIFWIFYFPEIGFLFELLAAYVFNLCCIIVYADIYGGFLLIVLSFMCGMSFFGIFFAEIVCLFENYWLIMSLIFAILLFVQRFC